MKITIDVGDKFDEIYNSMLVEDWARVNESIKEIESKEVIRLCELEDLLYYKKVKDAYAVVIRYCHPADDADEILGVEE